MPIRDKRGLLIALGITMTFFVIEVMGGVLTGSLALLADAGHMLTDAASLGLALFAIRLASRPATLQKTYGYHRMEILAALLNGMTLWLIVAYIFYEAFRRFGHPPEVKSLPMLAIAIVGLVANLTSGLFLSRSAGESLNVRGAFLHVLGDALSSVGVIIAGLIIFFTAWYPADPIISVLIGFLILYSSWRLMRESVHILMEGTPAHIDLKQIKRAMERVAGVASVHDLHVWAVTSGFETMSGHVILQPAADHQQVLERLCRLLQDEFSIRHATIQLEGEGRGCIDCAAQE